MIFTEISTEELEKHQQSNPHRFFFSQHAAYKKLANFNHRKAKILGVKDGEHILAYAIFIYYQHKKIFFNVTAQHGPVMDYSNKELTNFYFSELKKYFAKEPRVVSVRISPFINEVIYEDINQISTNPLAINLKQQIEHLGYQAMQEDLFTNPTLASRCIFSKPIENLTTDTLLKHISQIARYTINKTIKEGLLIREIDIFNDKDAKIFDDINQDTAKRIDFEVRNLQFFKNIKHIFGDAFKLYISYIDCKLFIDSTHQTITDLEKEKSELETKLAEGKLNPKKANNRIKELNENILIWQNKIQKIEELKEKEGNIIYISCASFLECGEDLIYFTSGAMQKYNRYEGPYAVLYHMMNYAIAHKFKYFNFYGTSSDFTENASDYGVLQFKRNFNGNIEYFLDNFELKNSIKKWINI